MTTRAFSFLGTGTVKELFSSILSFKGHLEQFMSRFADRETFELGALKQLTVMDQCKLTTFWKIEHKAYFKGLECNAVWLGAQDSFGVCGLTKGSVNRKEVSALWKRTSMRTRRLMVSGEELLLL